jgi:hypothetical protein
MGKLTINLDSLKTRKDWKRLKIKDGSNILRFLPPFDEKANGYPYHRWFVVWGLLDPNNGRMRPYASPLEQGETCPVSEYVKELEKKVAMKVADFQKEGKSVDEIKEMMKPLAKVISDLRPRKIYAWNAVDKSGQVGLVELKSTAHSQLKELMNTYIADYDQDPTSVLSEQDDSGVWFNVMRSGDGFDTEYKVEKVQTKIKVDNRLTFVDDQSPLPPNVVENWKNLTYDLTSIYQTVGYDELKNVLCANMTNILEFCPEAFVEGFEPTADAIKTDKTTVEKQQLKTTPTQTTVTKKVGLRLGDETETTTVKTQTTIGKTQTAPTTKISQEDEDVFSLADKILGTVK